MTGKIVNLRRVRKSLARDRKRAASDKATRPVDDLARARTELEIRSLEAKRLARDEDGPAAGGGPDAARDGSATRQGGDAPGSGDPAGDAGDV